MKDAASRKLGPRGSQGGVGGGSAPGPAAFRRVLLVGFMASGKTRVGRLLAEALNWSFRDFDDEIETRVGLPIPEIFRQHGEGFFRALEEKLGSELLSEGEVVLASGGGWPAAPGRMESIGEDTLSVWLQVTPEEAVRRARMEGLTRPLLSGPDPVTRARALLTQRISFYEMAKVAVNTAGAQPEELARSIEDFMNEKG